MIYQNENSLQNKSAEQSTSDFLAMNRIKRSAVISLLAMTFSGAVFAMMATHTGRMEYATSVTGQQIVKCEYTTGFDKFWVTIRGGFCPATIEVE
ncbi:hypothetical protein [Limnohabitans sp. DM1]|uniref:hypothetical protein n=1 Tax=Limnohabitans sp. DM1 TaxID=1597955 RepID=UPI000B0A6085|nr:hypothetical protein [Limnohabitans sp. DM1]